MHDLVVRNGTVIDGTGSERKHADVAIDDGRISAVGDVGGVGGLGALVARWIVARGARNVALLGRTATTGGELQRQLEEQGARVWVLRTRAWDDSIPTFDVCCSP